MKLSELNINQSAIIVKVAGYGGFRKRIVEMGFIKGKLVTRIGQAPLGDPIEFEVMGCRVLLRKKEAAEIEVISKEEAEAELRNNHPDDVAAVISEEEIRAIALEKRKKLKVALIGNPNCGKTSLYNLITGAHERVGNYSGVTVDAKEAFVTYKGYSIQLVDLPGTYSLSPYSPEEKYVRNYITESEPDVIINIVDASNIERNLYLTTELIDMNLRMVIALNLFDELKRKGDEFDYHSLGSMIGVPIIPTSSKEGLGISQLLDTVINSYECADLIDEDGQIAAQAENDVLIDNQYHTLNIPHHHSSKADLHSDLNYPKTINIRHIHINYGEILENAIRTIKGGLSSVNDPITQYTPRYLAIKLLENDSEINRFISTFQSSDKLFNLRDAQIKYIETYLRITPEQAFQDAKYGFISGALKETYKPAEKKNNTSISDKIDAVVTNKYLGYPIFLCVLFIMFETTFNLGAYPMQLIECGIDYLAQWLSGILPAGMLTDLLTDGIIKGVGGVLVFLPNILILYFFINLLEMSGYMARVAFIMDKIMHKIGLHGRSFIPLVMGFGCNVPAIMATRTIENRSARMVTILISPFISCSARLPIYLLLVMTFFPHYPGVMLFLVYFIGIFLAAFTAIVFKKFLFKKDEVPFVMELPPYRIPTIRSMLSDTWIKCAQYLKKIGTTILVGSVIIWALSYFPMYNGMRPDELTPEQRIEQKTQSIIGHIGRGVQPILAPLGFDWKVSVALIAGVSAKEIVISTLGILYDSEEGEATTSSISLSERLLQEKNIEGEPLFNSAVVLALMLFVLIYIPCLGTIATIKAETQSWLWTLFSICYSLIVAWLISWIAYTIVQYNIWQEAILAVVIMLSIGYITNKVVTLTRYHRERKNNCAECSGDCNSCLK